MCGGSFAGFEAFEEIPLEQFYLMLKIHNEAVEAQNREIEAARRGNARR